MGEGDWRCWRDVPEQGSSPFVHRFQTPQQPYVYDVNTRRIIRVSPVVWDVLEEYGCRDDREILATYAGVHGRDRVADALREISLAREEQGLFLSVRPKQVVPPSGEMIRRSLEDEREQLVLNVTDDCNFRCSYCVFGGQHEHFRPHSAKAMSWGVARLAIEKFLAHSRSSKDRVISFYGGEPLLNLPLIRQCVGHTHENQGDLAVRFSLTTNGSLLRGEAAEFLAEEDFLLVVSLDGPAEIHDRHRRGKAGGATWSRVMSNLREFVGKFDQYATNGQLRFNAVATRQTDLRAVDRFCGATDVFTESMGLGISEQMYPAEGRSEARADDSLADSARALHEEFLRDLKSGNAGPEHLRTSRWVQAALFEKPLIAFHKRGYLSPHLPEDDLFLSSCIAGARRMFVNVAGDYFACERVVPSQCQIIGNVRDDVDVAKISALAGQWVKASRGQCRYCWCLSYCKAGCLATTGQDGEITEEVKSRLCARYRLETHRLLIEYCEILEQNPQAFDYAADFELR